MNHAEAVINDMFEAETPNKLQRQMLESTYSDLWGFNMRMTEIQAAILQEQLNRLDGFIQRRQANANYLATQLIDIPPIWEAPIRPGCTHSYYVQAFLWQQQEAEGIRRGTFINAVKAELTGMDGRESEGVRIGNGYIKPLYRMPIFENQTKHLLLKQMESDPAKLFPNVERLWKDELFLHLYLAMPTAKVDLDDIVRAFHKVWDNREEMRC